MVEEHKITDGKSGYAKRPVIHPSTQDLKSPAKMKYGYTVEYRQKIEKYHKEKFDAGLL